MRRTIGTESESRKIEHCGRCMPCIFRRAALHSAGLDDETYGNDVCAGEVDIIEAEGAANDLRACLSFIRQEYSQSDIAERLIANGPLPPESIAGHAATVERAIEELRQLLRDKAIPVIRESAGIK